jgi:hypothetical protein
MRMAQERTPAGCLFALAAAFLVMAFVIPDKTPFLDYTVVSAMFLGGVVLVAYRKIYPDAILITDALPQPGETFRGKVETPLKSEPPQCTVQLVVSPHRGRYQSPYWQQTESAHPMRGERGIVLPAQFAVPADVASKITQLSVWRLNVRAGFYRASFKLEAAGSAQNPITSV